MLMPALPSLDAKRPSEPGVSASVTARISSSVAAHPCWAKTFLATALLSTTSQIIPPPSMTPALMPVMLTFFSPSAVAICPNIPGRSGTESVSCLARGITRYLLRQKKRDETPRVSLSADRLESNPDAERDQDGAECGVDRLADAGQTQPAAHPLHGEGVGGEPGEGEEAEGEAEGQEQDEARLGPGERGQEADEEGDHLGVGEVAQAALGKGAAGAAVARRLRVIGVLSSQAHERAHAEVDQVGRAGEPDGEEDRLGGGEHHGQARAGRHGPGGLARGHAGRGGEACWPATRERVADGEGGVLPGRADDEQGHAEERQVRSEADHRELIVAMSALREAYEVGGQ